MTRVNSEVMSKIISADYCPLCSRVTRPVFQVQGSVPGHFLNVYHCHQCSAHFTAPLRFDYETYDEDLITYYEAHRDYILWRHNLIFDYLGAAFGMECGRFLDIGSGAGYSLEVAAKRGWYVQGVEPGNTLAEYSQKRHNGRVIHGYFSPDISASLQAANPAGYDYLLIDNVLEHISEPVVFMEQALSLLAEQGIALVAIPPVDWLRVLLGRNNWVRAHCRSAQFNLFYDPEQHVNYFSRRAMRRLIEQRLGYTLLPNRFHHSRILENPLARLLRFETGYFFITRSTRKV